MTFGGMPHKRFFFFLKAKLKEIISEEKNKISWNVGHIKFEGNHIPVILPKVLIPVIFSYMRKSHHANHIAIW